MKLKLALNVALTLTLLSAAVPLAMSQTADTVPASHPDAKTDPHHGCPMMADQQRADEGMGFSQAKTTHHFRLTGDGGVIAVEANDAKDSESRDQIRMHLTHIAKAFSTGDFDIPMFVHDQVPPGVPVMKSLKDAIHYRFEETDLGGRVVISSADQQARAAIHEFLAFQIREHKTGDSLDVQ
ncbi:MAG: hypothetical protein LAO03_03265 [Acidobacteriia bacterium]|nr:hypothetical protein [Terriglobia bacterium]